MQVSIIGATFLLGVACVVMSFVAFFRTGRTGGGSLELPGITLTAKSAAALFLVVGAAMVLSGFAWASTNSTKDEAVRGAAELHEAYNRQVALTRELSAKDPAILKELPPDKAKLIETPPVTLSPRLKAEISKLPRR
jgi:hypothetical protein